MATVSIACKLPHGIFAQLYKMVETPTGPQGLMTPTAEPEGERIRFNGSNHRDAIAGWGVTDNVDEHWANAWMAQNSTLQAVKAGLIFVRASAAKIAGEAKEKALVLSGFEALDPTKPPQNIAPVTKD